MGTVLTPLYSGAHAYLSLGGYTHTVLPHEIPELILGNILEKVEEPRPEPVPATGYAPFLAVGNDELGDPVGDKAVCPNCKKKHKVKYGTDKDGKESKLLGFVSCTDGGSYLVSISGELLK